MFSDFVIVEKKFQIFFVLTCMCISFHINNATVLIGNLSQNFSNLFNNSCSHKSESGISRSIDSKNRTSIIALWEIIQLYPNMIKFIDLSN